MAVATEIRTGVVRPMECLQSGWKLVKDQYWLFVGITAAGVLIASLVPMAILLGPMLCGLYLCYFAKMRGEPVSFDLLWRGFDYFAPSVLATLILVGAAIAVVMPVEILFAISLLLSLSSQPQSSEPQFTPLMGASIAAYVIVVLLFSVLSIFFVFIYPLIVDRNLRPVEAIFTSIKAVWANLGGMLGLLLMLWAISLAGVCTCYVGLFLTAPILFAANAFAYRAIFPASADASPYQ